MIAKKPRRYWSRLSRKWGHGRIQTSVMSFFYPKVPKACVDVGAKLVPNVQMGMRPTNQQKFHTRHAEGRGRMR